MNDASLTRASALLLAFALSVPLAACSGGGSAPTPATTESMPSPTAGDGASSAARQIDDLGQALNVDGRGRAIEEIVRQGLTLGLLDEAGNQLNPNVPEDSLSLRPEGVAAHASLIPGSHYRTIDYVVESLAGSGVTLASTDETITLDHFLPDLQQYVDWSFSNPDDPRSTLGLLIGSGHRLRVPASPPTLAGDTLISPLASSMMAADILLGIEDPDRQGGDDLASTVVSFFVVEAHAGDDQEGLQFIKGLLTTIRPLREGVIDVLPKEWRGHAGGIWARIEAGNRFAVRLTRAGGQGTLTLPGPGGEGLPGVGVTKRIVLDRTGQPKRVGAVITLAPDTGVIAPVPASYVLSLIGPGQGLGLGLPLFPDADARLSVAARPDPGATASVGYDGHRIEMTHLFCVGNIEATQLAGERRDALLFASATLQAPLDDLPPEITFPLQALGINIADIKTAIAGIRPTPWVAAVELHAQEGLECGNENYSEAAGGGLWFEGCRLNGLPHGTVRHYNERGSLHSECVYDRGKQDGFCTTYYARPADARQCEASYVDDELEWEACYFTSGARQSALAFAGGSGLGRTYHRSGRLFSECHYANDGPIECQSYCDNDAGTLCGEQKTDQDGDVVIEEWDECSTACR